jgi:tRNA A37 threonylcarbamoyladenosine modification protein TsaB
VGVPSTESQVFGAAGVGDEVAVVIDARSQELYFARYRRTEHGVEVLVAPRVLVATELLPELPHGSLVFADDDAVAAARLAQRADLRIDRLAGPRARAALELGLARRAEHATKSTSIEPSPSAPLTIEPLYLRAFAAKSRRR